MRNRLNLKRLIFLLMGTIFIFGAVASVHHMATYAQGTPAFPKEGAPSGPGGFGLPFGMGGLAMSPDGKTVAAGQADFRIGIWDVRSGKLLSNLHGHSATVTGLVYAPDGKTLYSCGLDGSIIAWNMAAGGTPRQLNGKASIVGLALSADGKSLFVRTDAQKLQQYELATGLLKGEIALAPAAH